jgi:hypothetical protein
MRQLMVMTQRDIVPAKVPLLITTHFGVALHVALAFSNVQLTLNTLTTLWTFGAIKF